MANEFKTIFNADIIASKNGAIEPFDVRSKLLLNVSSSSGKQVAGSCGVIATEGYPLPFSGLTTSTPFYENGSGAETDYASFVKDKNNINIIYSVNMDNSLRVALSAMTGSTSDNYIAIAPSGTFTEYSVAKSSGKGFVSDTPCGTDSLAFGGMQYRNIVSTFSIPSAILFSVDFSLFDLSTAGNSAALTSQLTTSGFVFSRASAATVQTSTSAVVVSGIGVDTLRIGNAGYGRGLVLEEARTNILQQSRNRADPWWNSGTGTVTDDYATGSDGVTVVDRQVCTPGQFGNYASPTVVLSSSYVFSQWARRGVVGVASTLGQYVQDATTADYGDTQIAVSLTDDWQRVESTYITMSGTSATISLVEGRNVPPTLTPATARDAVVDLAQFEVGTFTTEAIVTAGASATRATDRLQMSALTIASCVQSGRASLEFRFIPKANKSAYGTPQIWYEGSSGGNGAYIKADGTISIAVGGISYDTASPITWSKGDIVDLWIESGGGLLNTVAKYRLNGGAAVTLGTSAAPQGSISPSGVAEIFGYNANATYAFSVWLQSIKAYSYNRRPEWAV